MVILITGAMNLMAPSPKNSHSAPAQNKKTTTQPVQSNDTVKQNSGNGKTSSQSTNTNNTANAGQYYTTVKTMDKQIVQFSEKLNRHLNSNASFKGTNYDAEGRNILQTIRSNRDKLNNDSSINGADKQKLLHLYDLEITRISGMVDGVASSKKGGEYLPYFKSGTSAAYEFDDAIAAYDKEH